MKKILVVGNHCCSNRGDAAILRGLIDFIDDEYPEYSIDITSRYADGAKWFFDNDVYPDTLAKEKNRPRSILGRLEKRISNKWLLPLYIDGKLNNKKITPKQYTEFASFIEKYDLIIQVGGSFFVDLYGIGQFEAAAVAIKEKKPILMIGHSVGPFKDINVAKIANKIFAKTDSLILRESVSEEHLDEIGLNKSNYVLGSDTAWLIDPEKYPSDIAHLEAKYIKNRPTIAITMRDLAPFDVRLGVSQSDYEQKMASLCRFLIDSGYNIVAMSTCTGFDSYHRDDRIPALRVKHLLDDCENFSVVMEELTDVELGNLLSKCVLTIGTRLHSAILSMRFGTPAFAIYYEHKSLGILNQVGMAEYSVEIKDIDTDDFKSLVLEKISNIDSEKKTMQEKLSIEFERCKNVIRHEFSKVHSSQCEQVEFVQTATASV